MTSAKTKTGTGVEALARLDEERRRVNARAGELRRERDAIEGALDGVNGARRGGRLAEIKREVDALKRDALRSGEPIDEVLASLEAEQVALMRRAEELRHERRQVLLAEKAIEGDGANVLVRHHEEFRDLADAEVASGNALLGDLVLAARACLAKRQAIRAAVGLAVGGVTPDQQAVVIERGSPFVGKARSASQAMWSAVEALAAGEFSPPGSARTLTIEPSTLRGHDFAIEDPTPEDLAPAA